MLTPMSGSFEETGTVDVMTSRHSDTLAWLTPCGLDHRPCPERGKRRPGRLPIVRVAQAGGYARPELLVDTAWLAQHLNDSNIRIVDMRARGYGDGHIPEAVFLDNNWIRNPKAPPTFLPTPQEFEALMSRLGISNTTRVIAYDERGGIYAARLWWILNHYGHSNVALLDGGWVKWTAEQRATNDHGASGRGGDVHGEARAR